MDAVGQIGTALPDRLAGRAGRNWTNRDNCLASFRPIAGESKSRTSAAIWTGNPEGSNEEMRLTAEAARQRRFPRVADAVPRRRHDAEACYHYPSHDSEKVGEKVWDAAPLSVSPREKNSLPGPAREVRDGCADHYFKGTVPLSADCPTLRKITDKRAARAEQGKFMFRQTARLVKQVPYFFPRPRALPQGVLPLALRRASFQCAAPVRASHQM